MARFSYVSIDLKGKTLSGEISATDLKDARVKIKQKGLTPLQIKPLGGLGREKEKSKPSKPFRSKEKILSETKKGVRGKRREDWLRVLETIARIT
jgi:type II secretory pathway component PulF